MPMKNKVVVEEHWDNYVAEHDQCPVFVSYDRTAGDNILMQRLVHCARVMIPVHTPNRNGGPTADESVLLWNMEDCLCEFLAKQYVDCRLVARLTYKGMRELIFQLSDWNSFRPVVGAWMIQNENYQIDISEHE